MERTESWHREQQSQVVAQQPQRKASHDGGFKMQQIISDRVTEEIQDDLTSLRNKQNKTPLVFYCKLGSSYLLSFKKSDTASFLARFIFLAAFLTGAQIFVQKISTVSAEIKLSLIIITIIQIMSFVLLFFLDPGTLIEDQEQRIDEQRLYCQTCRVYRSHNSHHCVFCVKCVKGYDHHCGFFSKCIGRRNYLLFCLFLLSSGVAGIGSMGSLMFTVFKRVAVEGK